MQSIVGELKRENISIEFWAVLAYSNPKRFIPNTHKGMDALKPVHAV
jgi:hypothetical protein